MDTGYIKIYRKLHNSNMWTSEPFSRPQAWIDLIMLANWKDGFIRVAGQKVDILRGQCGWSEIRLAERWKWSREKTRNFLRELVNEKQITKKTNTRTTIITICNYCIYQDNNTTDQTTDQTTETHQKNIRPDTIEEGKERKERKERKEDNNIELLSKEKSKVENLRGTRLSIDWELEEEDGNWAEKEFGMTFEQVMMQAKKFKDYWIAKAGAGGIKRDWKATWRNWIRNDFERKTK